MPEQKGRPFPPRPSREHLRKQAKRLAKDRGVQLAVAQRILAAEYSAASWSQLMQQVDEAADRFADLRSPLAQAAVAGDLAAMQSALDRGVSPHGEHGEPPPLWLACAGTPPGEVRLAMADILLRAGANPRQGVAGSTPLHAAAAQGPVRLVERLIAAGALEWQPDGRGWSVVDAARTGSAPDRREIATLVDRPVISDPTFRAAVRAIQSGDVDVLARLLTERPSLLQERVREPDCYHQAPRPNYFLDPRLFWFIANNPRLVADMPANTVEIADVMIARGVTREDLDYALELVMTSAAAREHGLQTPLIQKLLAAGAQPSETAIASALAHKELEPIRALEAAGVPLDAAMAAGLDRAETLRELLLNAPREQVQLALALAAINGHEGVARVALEFKADPNAFMPVHAHSVPLHQAALTENIRLLELLIGHGARTDIRDKMWNGTPLDWSVHEGKHASRAFLSARG